MDATLYRGPMKIDWEKEHAVAGSNAGGGTDTARYALIGGLLSQLPAGASVLDVGCGSGTLRKYMRPDLDYTGMDVSETACKQARLAYPNDEFLCSDASRWQGVEQWDAVVLNEVLYYLDAPEVALRKFAAAVKPGGTLLVSTYLAKTFPWQKNPNKEVAKLVRAFFEPVKDKNNITLGLSRNFFQWEVAFGRR